MDDGLNGFLRAAGEAVGPRWVDDSRRARDGYGASELPAGPVPPAAVVRPGSTDEVRAVVRLANEYGVTLHPISTGQNLGLGGTVAARPGNVVLDLGHRMNRILEFDETLRYVVVEPGVTYQALADFLVEQGDHLMCDTTSGPPAGGPLGNTLDKGGGYTPAADHFGNSCGLEVVLGDGRLLRTSDGAVPDSRTWHLAKYGLGPFLDGLFLQSNYGIVTRMGIWLQPRPPVIRSFFFVYPEDDDIAEIVEIVRDLRLNGTVPTAIKATGDLYSLASRIPYPGERPISDDTRKQLHGEYGVGAWIVSGALYGASRDDVEPRLATVRSLFEATGKARYVAHEEAWEDPGLKIHIDTYGGRPTAEETKMLNWRGGGLVSLTPSTPMIGSVARQHQRLSRDILARHRIDTCIDYIFAGRASRGLHSIMFDPSDPEECRDVATACTEFRSAYAEAGYPCGRVPADMQASEMGHRDATFRSVLHDLKRVLDPLGVLSPGRYGIG
ncbi:FAD-binding oxidoreductase [Pseudonocardia acaciae]|uniref:FAD-binding oxidoreductase n=1 Tax=Pseudonocardia acaciae TaxID=551276 RepID=UPI00048B55AC|nr:FAD-binding oxidoreductase [Pseudonocardia acaciae]